MASTYITRTPSSDGNKRTWTFSAWFKKGSGGYLFGAGDMSDGDPSVAIEVGNTIEFRIYAGGHISRLVPTQVTRDNSAWYHYVVAVDTTQATSSNRVKVYINGTQVTSFSTEEYMSQNYDTMVNSSSYAQRVGDRGGGNFDGCMAHVHLTDGTAYPASTFAETDSVSGIWKPKTAPSVTYGTNGFFLKFENSGNLDLDSSGNNHTFSTSGTLTQNVDTPSNNFATMNPLDNFYANGTFANGNNTVTSVSGDATYNTSTLGVSSGKWYWECKWSAQPTGSTNQVLIGITKRPTTNANFFLGMKAWTYAYMAASGAVLQSDSTIITYNTYSIGDIIGVALDLDNNRLYFSKNGVFQNSSNPPNGTNPISITAPDSTAEDSGAYFAGFGDGNSNLQETGQFNFGNGYFGTTAVASANADGNGHGKMEYSVPSGFYTLNTKNLKEFG